MRLNANYLPYVIRLNSNDVSNDSIDDLIDISRLLRDALSDELLINEGLIARLLRLVLNLRGREIDLVRLIRSFALLLINVDVDLDLDLRTLSFLV